jgi:threonine/homoserine/homoserine lactone efflux protein
MTSTRLVQGAVFGLLLEPKDGRSTDAEESRLVLSLVLLVVAVLLLAMAVRTLVDEPDEDAPPPAWMTILDGVGPGRAYLMGAALIALGPKFWVFTLGAIAAIGAADLGTGSAIAAFAVFVLLAAVIHLTLLVATFAAPARADAALGRLSGYLTTYGRRIKIALGFGFGLWFLVEALVGLGVL